MCQNMHACKHYMVDFKAKFEFFSPFFPFFCLKLQSDMFIYSGLQVLLYIWTGIMCGP